jgi:hypothetical protein
MAMFVVEVYRPGLTAGSASGLAQALEGLLESVAGDGSGVRYAGSTFAPADEVCYLRVNSPDRGRVEALIERLAWPDARISEVVDLE